MNDRMEPMSQRPRIHLVDGICHIEFTPGMRVDLESAEYIFHQRVRLMGTSGHKQKLLVIANRALALDYSASRFSVSPRVAGTITACAVISESSLERTLAALFTNLFKPPYPFRLFARREDALAWLAGFPDC